MVLRHPGCVLHDDVVRDPAPIVLRNRLFSPFGARLGLPRPNGAAYARVTNLN
jgi:hypothetical protein